MKVPKYLNYCVFPAIILTLYSFAVAVPGTSPESEGAQTRFRVAAIIPLTGGNAEQGQWIQNGLELAAARLQEQSGTSVDLRFEDSQGDPRQAVTAYTNIAAQGKPTAVITWGSGVGLALTPKVNRDGVIQIGVATATPDYRSEGDYTFRNFPSAELEAGFLVETLITRMAVARIGIVKINNDYGLGSARTFRDSFEKRGGEVVFDEEIEPNTTDFRSTLTKIKQKPVEYLYLALYPSEGAMFIKQARSIGLESEIIASTALLGASAFFQITGTASNNVMVASSLPEYLQKRGEAVEHFYTAYETKYGEPPGLQHVFAARAYDALLLLGQAYRDCQTRAASCIRDRLYAVRSYEGASGNLTFDSAGDVQTSFTLYRVANGKFEPAALPKAEPIDPSL